jgi:hypothetical protein
MLLCSLVLTTSNGAVTTAPHMPPSLDFDEHLAVQGHGYIDRLTRLQQSVSRTEQGSRTSWLEAAHSALLRRAKGRLRFEWPVVAGGHCSC